MPALSQKQQKFFGLVHQCKKDGYKNCASPEIEKIARDMKAKDIEDFAATKHTNLPNKVKKEIEETMKKLELRKMIKEELGKGTDREGAGGASICVCPKCGYETTHDRSTPCNKMKCPKCGTSLTGKGAPGEVKEAKLRKIIKEEIRKILNEKVYNFKNKVIGTIVSLTLSSDAEAKETLKDFGKNWVLK